jgi:hypothetical protein
LNVDPDAAESDQPYSFAQGDPVNGSDPSGAFFVGDDGQTAGVDSAGVTVDDSENSAIQAAGDQNALASEPGQTVTNGGCQSSASSPPASVELGNCPGGFAPPKGEPTIPNGGAYPAYAVICAQGFFGFGVSGCVSRTAAGQTFVSGGGGIGLGKFGVQAGVGFIVDSHKPTACDIQTYLEGRSVQAGGGFVVGGEVVWGNYPASGQGNYGFSANLTFPGLSATITYGIKTSGPNEC